MVPTFLRGPRTRLFCIALCLSGLQKVDVRGPHTGAGINLAKTGWQGERDGKDRLAGRRGDKKKGHPDGWPCLPMKDPVPEGRETILPSSLQRPEHRLPVLLLPELPLQQQPPPLELPLP